MVMSLMTFSIIAFTPHIILISILISYIAQWSQIAACSSMWPPNCHMQLHNLFSQTCNVISPPPTELLLLRLPSWVCLLLVHSLKSCCHELRVYYSWAIVQIVHGIMQLIVKTIKEMIFQVLLDFAYAQHHRVFLLSCLQFPLQMGYIY